MNDTKQSETAAHRSSSSKRIGIYAAVIIGVFLLGLIPRSPFADYCCRLAD